MEAFCSRTKRNEAKRGEARRSGAKEAMREEGVPSTVAIPFIYFIR